MEKYNTEVARYTLPVIGSLGMFVTRRARLLRAYDTAGQSTSWQQLAAENGVQLGDEQTVGRGLRALGRNIVPHLNVLADLGILGEAAFMMPETEYGQQCAASQLNFIQTVESRSSMAMTADYRMFTTGYAEVTLQTADTPRADVRRHIEDVWGQLALEQVADLPDTPQPERLTPLGVFQVGLQQVEAVASYVRDVVMRSSAQQG